MPEEHTGQLGFEYAWKELLARSRQSGRTQNAPLTIQRLIGPRCLPSGDLMICNSCLFDVDMFKSVWKPVISAIAYAFISFDDDYIIQRAIAGFRQCATLAGHFHLPDVFDFVVVSLSQATSLLSDSLPAQVPNYPIVDVEGQSITVSTLSVKFGTNFKGQLAAVVLFNIVNGNGNALREGWTQVSEFHATRAPGVSRRFLGTDLRNVPKSIPTLASPDTDVADGRLPGRCIYDSSPGKFATSPNSQE